MAPMAPKIGQMSNTGKFFLAQCNPKSFWTFFSSRKEKNPELLIMIIANKLMTEEKKIHLKFRL